MDLDSLKIVLAITFLASVIADVIMLANVINILQRKIYYTIIEKDYE